MERVCRDCGGNGPFPPTGRRCVACAAKANRQKQARYRKRYPERVKASQEKFQEEHPERAQTHRKKYWDANAEGLNAKQRARKKTPAFQEYNRNYTQKWREEHPEEWKVIQDRSYEKRKSKKK